MNPAPPGSGLKAAASAGGLLDPYARALAELPRAVVEGKVVQVIGLVIECTGFAARIGELCLLLDGSDTLGEAEVVGFRRSSTLLMALGTLDGIRPGIGVLATGRRFSVGVGEDLLGRVLDGLGRPLDGKGPAGTAFRAPLDRDPPSPLARRRILAPLPTGIRALDAFRTLGRGQRMGLFAGSGVGKSVTLGMIARYCRSEVNVIALIGERGREVKEFLEKDLGEEGLRRSVVVVATSDQPALVRLKAALVATAIAEFFRDAGKDVMLMMDSASRLAMAQREIGLTAGEPPTTRGYPPSVFAFLPRLFERAGMGESGSITALYTVLVDGDDLDEPVADAVRSILDGHIVLSRALANKNHYPAIDVLKSVSRCMSDVTAPEHREAAGRALKAMALYAGSEDLITLGAYAKGADPALDAAVAVHGPIEEFLVQGMGDHSAWEETVTKLKSLVPAAASAPAAAGRSKEGG